MQIYILPMSFWPFLRLKLSYTATQTLQQIIIVITLNVCIHIEILQGYIF